MNQSINNNLFITGLALILVTGFTAALLLKHDARLQPQSYSGVQTGQEYYATSTAASAAYGANINGNRVIKTGYGSLSAVVITGANTGVFNFYDATTTNVNLRTGQKASSSILVASFPASVAAGTYVLDATFSTALLLDLVSGSMPTSTITYR
jgi:hypothetical protein